MSAERSVATQSAGTQNSTFAQHSCKGIFEHCQKDSVLSTISYFYAHEERKAAMSQGENES